MKAKALYRILALGAVVATLLVGIMAHATTPSMALSGRRANYKAMREAAQDTLQNRYKPTIADSLRATYSYTEALKQATIHRDTAASRKLFMQTIAIDSMYAPAHYQLASHLIKQLGHEAEALQYARRAYLRDTMSRWYTDLYARALVINARYDEALPIYRRLMRMDGNNPDNYRILAVVYSQRKQPYSAIAVLDSADMRFGKIPYLSNMKRHLLITTGQMERAIEEAQQSVEAAPYEQENMVALGETYAAAGRDSLARTTLQQAIAMDSTNASALGAYADYCSQKRDTKGYLETLQRLYRLDDFPLERKITLFEQLTSDRKFYGNNYFAFGAMATAMALSHSNDKRVVDIYTDHLLAGGEVEAALAHLKLHLQDEPPQMDYYMAVIDIEDYLQRADSVDYYVQRAVTLFPDDPVLYIRKANRQYVRGDLHGAIETFHEARKYARTDSLRGELWGYIGDTYHAMVERVRAGAKADTTGYTIRLSDKRALKLCFEAYDQALELYPDNVMALNNYAYFLSEEDMELEKALKMSARVINLEKSNSTYLDTFAWILYKLGRVEQARTHMRQALSLDTTKSAELPLHYGDILFALGERFMADTYWRKALDMGGDKSAIEQRLAIPKQVKQGRVEEILEGDKRSSKRRR